VTPDSLKRAYMGLDENRKTMLELFREHNEKCKSLENIDFAPGTILKYVTTLKHLEDLLMKVLGKNDLLMKEVTPMFIKDFEIYLKTEK
jgi:hypothetical protein